MCTFFDQFCIAIYWEGGGPFSGCTVLREVHPVSAQNKSLISDTDIERVTGYTQRAIILYDGVVDSHRKQ